MVPAVDWLNATTTPGYPSCAVREVAPLANLTQDDCPDLSGAIDRPEAAPCGPATSDDPWDGG